MKTSLNGHLILEPYRKVKELEAKEVVSGFSMAAAKVGIESLNLLVDSKFSMGDNVVVLKKGTKIYFKEEVLHVKDQYRKAMESEEFPEGFAIGSISDVLFFEE